ncbi:MAG: hypothetical protein HY689_14510 [Chloroflexi bacterium]|nr:hypothetical protein [Chloroflexota bacterium]
MLVLLLFLEVTSAFLYRQEQEPGPVLRTLQLRFRVNRVAMVLVAIFLGMAFTRIVLIWGAH